MVLLKVSEVLSNPKSRAQVGLTVVVTAYPHVLLVRQILLGETCRCAWNETPQSTPSYYLACIAISQSFPYNYLNIAVFLTDHLIP
jgi:hypothetical protein